MTVSAAQAEVVVDLAAVRHNIGILAEHARGADVMAVVKADGYNHGAAEVARAALAAGAAEIGTTTIGEAVALRAAGIDAPILCWLNTSDADYLGAVRAGVEVAVPSVAHLRAVTAAARTAGAPAAIALKVDTGLGRNGVAAAEFPDLLAELGPAVADGTVRLRAMFSHLAQADIPRHPMNGVQRDRLAEAVATATSHGLRPDRVHLANSAATLTRPDLAFDLVRPGIAVYGLSPVPEFGDFGLRPAMTFRARVTLVKRLRAGQGVSYGHRWIAPRDTTVALIPAGYADGVPRTLSGRFDVGIDGARYPSVGRVCMDQVVVDLGDNPAGIAEGDPVVLFGGDPGQPTAQEWADTLDTIHYEIVCAPRGRAVRRYVDG
ncbi:alanine racemase [Nocardia terpenica]|uniref:alanine racemase n=1 Tax=Nocardia terpenica TaxID=455432 RepID=UPI001E4F58CB|nr:alanine racemase [Nocardia terpenica]